MKIRINKTITLLSLFVAYTALEMPAYSMNDKRNGKSEKRKAPETALVAAESKSNKQQKRSVNQSVSSSSSSSSIRTNPNQQPLPLYVQQAQLIAKVLSDTSRKHNLCMQKEIESNMQNEINKLLISCVKNGC